MESETIDRIFHAKEILDDNKEKLIDNYVDDYGRYHKWHIKENLNSTVYIFDSTPDVNYYFIRIKINF